MSPRRWVDVRGLAAFALRSPGRLAAVIGAAAVVAVMLAHVATPPATAPTRPTEPAGAQSGAPAGAPHSSAPRTVTATPTPQTGTPTPTPTPARATGSPSTVPPDVADVSQLADQFVATWADHTMTRTDWFQAVRPMITDHLARELRYTKPGNVPARQVTGAVTVDAGPPITADVPTDAGTVRVIIVRVGQDYRVDRII